MNTVQTLQVFNGGKPCGWLGQTPTEFWFHYSSNNPQQQWVSLLMPPKTNFYRQMDLFPVFAQHATTLLELQLINGQHLGSLSFANPDNPVVTPPLRTPPSLNEGQRALISNPNLTHIRKPFADTMAHHHSAWSTIQMLKHIKKQVDPNDQIHGLRWALQAQRVGELVLHPRPDLATYHQYLYGFEALHAIFNINPNDFKIMSENNKRFVQMLQEVIRTYCKQFSSEMNLLQHLLPSIKHGQISVHLVYEQLSIDAHHPYPRILGFEYLPIPHAPMNV